MSAPATPSATPPVETSVPATAWGSASGSGSALPATVVAALQDALAAEQQAVWGYPVLGPLLTDPGQVQAARAADDAHARLVVDVMDLLAAAGRPPVAPRAQYPLPAPLVDAGAAVVYAARLEDDAAAAWRFVVARAGEGVARVGADVRAAAVDALVAAAVRGARWRAVRTPAAATVAFPGGPAT